MCLILDTNKYSDFLDPTKKDMDPVRKWIKNGKIAWSPTKKMQQELQNHRIRERFHQYRQAGKIKMVSEKEVEKAKKNLSALHSDDPDIIALAIVAKIKLLVSGDINLHKDFKEIIGGKIYQYEKHSNLLRSDICP